MLKQYLFHYFILVTLFSNVQMISIERNGNFEANGKNYRKLLSRRRRYLIFPEGSSIQLVYDQIIGMVDTTNLHIFGITCSLAWQLPHKSFFSEKDEEPAKHNNKISISELDNKRMDYNYTSQKATEQVYHFDTYYDRSNYHSHKINNSYYEYLKAKPKYDDWQRYRTNKLNWNYSHDIYPAIRMRRHIANHYGKINGNDIHPKVKQLLHHHRETRFTLYKSIEKYLNARGENGEECIKLAICETTQIEYNGKSKDPAPFFKELLRVVFSLPSPKFHSDAEIQPNKYDTVLNEIDQNNAVDCYSKYPSCSTSIWSENFIF